MPDYKKRQQFCVADQALLDGFGLRQGCEGIVTGDQEKQDHTTQTQRGETLSNGTGKRKMHQNNANAPNTLEKIQKVIMAVIVDGERSVVHVL